MGKFKDIQTELETLNAEHSEKVESVKKRAIELLTAKLKDNAKLKESVLKLESSTELTSTEHDEYYSQWIRFDASDFIDVDSSIERDAFESYMSENHCMTIDFKNDALTYSIGPCILINDDGDVLDQDSGKWFLKKSDYETESERNELIEKYMTKSGYFPSVIRCDYHGNAFYENTKESDNDKN